MLHPQHPRDVCRDEFDTRPSVARLRRRFTLTSRDRLARDNGEAWYRRVERDLKEKRSYGDEEAA